jgi:hypothetical protein
MLIILAWYLYGRVQRACLTCYDFYRILGALELCGLVLCISINVIKMNCYMWCKCFMALLCTFVSWVTCWCVWPGSTWNVMWSFMCAGICGTNLNGVGMYTLLVRMHVLLVNACSSVMLATKCLVQVKHYVSTSYKLLCHVWV